MDDFRGKPAWFSARLLSAAASDNAAVAITQRCALRQLLGVNKRASEVYLKLYDKATAPTNADTPKMTVCLPAGQPFAIDLGGGFFFNACGYRLTTGSADNDAGAVAAGDILGLNLLFS